MRIQAIGGQFNSATWFWVQALKKYSKHDIDAFNWSPVDDHKPDLVHFNYATHFINHYLLPDGFVKKHPNWNYSITIMGPADYNRIASHLKDLPLKGIIALGSKYEEIIKKVSGDIPVYNLDAGVDTEIFSYKPPPKHFTVGCAFDHSYPLKDDNLRRLLRYRFPLVTCGEGIGTYRDFPDMPWFYENISVLVENDLTPSPGGLTPLEAGAVGRPTVGSREGNLADWFPREFLVNNDEEMVAKLTRLRDDPEYYKYASSVWHGLAKSRSWSIITREYDKVFDKMVGGCF